MSVAEQERPEKFWVPATSKHVARVMNGKEVEARFADDGGNWRSSRLMGWTKDTRYHWIDESRSRWNRCQVYDPPQWFIEKPEPGEEYRLLEKMPDEALQPGDEAVTVAGLWHESYQAKIGGMQVKGIWYRRKIEPPKPEPKYAVGQLVRVVGAKGKYGVVKGWNPNMDAFIGTVHTLRSEPRQLTDKTSWFYHLEAYPVHVFRENFLEPVVEPKHYVLQVGDTCDIPSKHRITITAHGVEVN